MTGKIYLLLAETYDSTSIIAASESIPVLEKEKERLEGIHKVLVYEYTKHEEHKALVNKRILSINPSLIKVDELNGESSFDWDEETMIDYVATIGGESLLTEVPEGWVGEFDRYWEYVEVREYEHLRITEVKVL